MSKKRIKIMIQGPNRRTYFRNGPIALHVSNNQKIENYMETLKLYDYIQIRVNGKRRDSIVQDLVDDMRRDKELAGKTGQEIVDRIRLRACSGAWEALGRFLNSYKTYCKTHNFQPESVKR